MSLSVASQRLHSHFDSQASASPPVTFRATSLIIIFFLWAAIYVAGMFTPALLDDADTVHAEAAREMVQRHDWVTLYVNGFVILKKLLSCIGELRPVTSCSACMTGARVFLSCSGFSPGCWQLTRSDAMPTANAADFIPPSCWLLPLALISSLGFLFPTRSLA